MIGNNLVEQKTLDKRNILILAVIFGALSVFLIILGLAFNGGIVTFNSDDIVQYRVMMVDFLDKLRSGNLSGYDYGIFYGRTIESLNYYVPLDAFTGLSFLLSYIFGSNIAYTIVETSKIIFIPIATYVLFSRLGFKPKTSLFASLIWVGSGISVFYNYPTYLTIALYLPITLLIIQKFRDNRRWIFAIWVFYLCLYNLYNAFSIILGSLLLTVVYGVVTSEKPKENLKNIILNPLLLGLFGILGFLLAGFWTLPSLSYMLTGINSGRGDTNILNFFFFSNWKKYIYLVFNSLQPNSVPYARGFPGSYIFSQGSIYMTFFGITALFELFTMRTKMAKKMKIFLIIELVSLVLPFVHYIMSASLTAYSRWYFYPILMNLAFAAYVCDEEEYKIDLFKNKYYLGIFAFLCLAAIAFNLIFPEYTGNEITIVLSIIGAVIVLISIIVSAFKGDEPEKMKKFAFFEIGAAVFLAFITPISMSVRGDANRGFSRMDALINYSEEISGTSPSNKVFVRDEGSDGYQFLANGKYMSTDTQYFDSTLSKEFNEYSKYFLGDSKKSQTIVLSNVGTVIGMMEMGYDTFVTSEINLEGERYNFYEDEMFYEKVWENENKTILTYKVKKALPFISHIEKPQILEENVLENHIQNKLNLLSLNGEKVEADYEIRKTETELLENADDKTRKQYKVAIKDLVSEKAETTIYEIMTYRKGTKYQIIKDVVYPQIVYMNYNLETSEIELNKYDLFGYDFRIDKAKGIPLYLIVSSLEEPDLYLASYDYAKIEPYYQQQKEVSDKIEIEYKSDEIKIKNNNNFAVNVELPLLNIGEWSESNSFYGMLSYKLDANSAITSNYNVKYLTEGLYISLGASVIFAGVVVGSSVYNLLKRRKEENVQKN